MSPLRLLVASGNEIARKGLCTLVREQPGWSLAVEARNGREAVEKVMLEKPDIAIMDLDMPSLNGIDATRQIAKIAMRTKVLLLAPHDAEFLLLQALEAGVSGYLLQSAKADDLIFAVESLHNGRPFFTARLARHASEEPLKILNSANDGKRFKTSRQLTPREREVIQLVAEGRSNKEVGFTLHISVKTAETHRANIMHKIDSHSIVELVRYAIRNQIIQA